MHQTMIKGNYIPRDLYFNQIEPYIGSGLIKVITGQRRVGKSYVLLQVMDEILNRDPGINGVRGLMGSVPISR